MYIHDKHSQNRPRSWSVVGLLLYLIKKGRGLLSD